MSPTPGKSSGGKLGQWPSLTSEKVNGAYKQVCMKINDIIGLKTSRSPENDQLSHYEHEPAKVSDLG